MDASRTCFGAAFEFAYVMINSYAGVELVALTICNDHGNDGCSLTGNANRVIGLFTYMNVSPRAL